jgi:hypothetical protein
MKSSEFIDSSFYKTLDYKVQALLKDLIGKLGNLDYVIIKRNEPVLVFKVRGMYENNPRSKANIATIRLKSGYITIGPYKNKDENVVICRDKEDITEELVEEVKEIYREKL